MKLLLDENLPQQMRLELAGHEVFTAAYMGWDRHSKTAILQIRWAHALDARLGMI